MPRAASFSPCPSHLIKDMERLMLTNQRPTRAVRMYALRFMVYGGPSNAMPVVVPRKETPKAALGTIGGGHWYKYRFTALRPFAFESACTRPQPRGRLDDEHHTSSSSSSPWPDTDRAPSFRRGYHRKTHAALKYCGAADVLSLLSLPPYSSTRHHLFLSRPDGYALSLASSGHLRVLELWCS